MIYLFIYLYAHMLVVIVCNFKQLGKYQIKYMNVYIEPLIDELLKLWVVINMYDICKLIRQRCFHSLEYLYGLLEIILRGGGESILLNQYNFFIFIL